MRQANGKEENRQATEKKAAVAKKMKPVKTKLTKSQVFEALAEDSGMAKSEVKKVWGSLERLIEASICDEATVSSPCQG